MTDVTPEPLPEQAADQPDELTDEQPAAEPEQQPEPAPDQPDEPEGVEPATQPQEPVTVDPAAVEAGTPSEAPDEAQEPDEAAPSEGPQHYTVQSGDRLSAIAERYGVTMQSIAEASGIQDGIAVGDELTIPVQS